MTWKFVDLMPGNWIITINNYQQLNNVANVHYVYKRIGYIKTI